MTDVILGNKSKNILPVDVQREYIQYHDKIDSRELPEPMLFKESKNLFLKKTSLDEKKKLLYLLAHNGSHRAYKLLQKYQKNTNRQLKAWVELCLQECAGRLGTELLDRAETSMVMSGVGGDGQRLRYYFVFSSENLKTFTPAQKAVIKKSSKLAGKKLKSKTESMNFGKAHVLLSVLLSMEISVEDYFQEMYKMINQKTEILRYHYYCNNVQKPTSKDIEEYLTELK